MRIAQVAPLTEAVPPSLYGGTERIVSFLTEELVAMGHEVTLFASGDSMTTAELMPMTRRALRLDPTIRDPFPSLILMLEKVAQQAGRFDIVHCHLDYLPFPLFRRLQLPFVTTLHGRLDMPELQSLFDEFGDVPVISVSHAQRAPLPQANWIATVQHGLPPHLLSPKQAPSGGYLAFLGRISPEKAPDVAIRLAQDAGRKIRIAAKVDRVDQAYFESVVRPLLQLPHVEWLGEICEGEKAAFLGGADALLFPIAWPEPFGLVMIEAMACGCPVIAFRGGSVAEVVEDGVTGFIVEHEADALAALERLDRIDRARIRQRFEARFTSRRMAEEYLVQYHSVAARAEPRLRVVQTS